MYYVNDRLLELIEQRGPTWPKKAAIVETVVVENEEG